MEFLFYIKMDQYLETALINEQQYDSTIDGLIDAQIVTTKEKQTIFTLGQQM